MDTAAALAAGGAGGVLAGLVVGVWAGRRGRGRWWLSLRAGRDYGRPDRPAKGWEVGAGDHDG